MLSKKSLTKRVLAKRRIRSKVSGTSDRLRLSVFRSNTFITAQLIDDSKGVTLGAARAVRSMKGAEELGKLISDKASIKTVVFDRNGYTYTGVVKAFADSARAAGLKF